MVGRIERLEAQLHKSASRIEALEAGLTTIDDKRRIADLKAKYSTARDRLKELKEAGNAKWEIYKTGIWIAWNDLENAFGDFEQSTPTENRK